MIVSNRRVYTTTNSSLAFSHTPQYVMLSGTQAYRLSQNFGGDS